MKIASIDIGTNTILLLVSKIINDTIIPIKEEYRIPRIGRDLLSKSEISKEAILDLILVLNDYKRICYEYEVDNIICFGTAPFRKAKNTKEVLQIVKNATGINVIILSEIEEAFYTFLGGVSNYSEFKDRKKFLVVDIGGASTEITLGCINEIYYMKSFPIGAVILKDMYFNNFPYKSPPSGVYEFLSKLLSELKYIQQINDYIPVAVAGTPTTISAIKIGLNDFIESKVDKTIIDLDFLSQLIHNMYIMPSSDILKHYPSIVKGREDVILPGAIILKYLMETINIKKINVSVRGVRYGIILKNLFHEKLRDFESKLV